MHGCLVYSVAETVNVCIDLCFGNTRYTTRIFASLVKQNMINTKRVPVEHKPLNLLLKAVSDGKPPPMFWGCKGRKENMTLTYLWRLFDTYTMRQAIGWTLTNTREALCKKLKDKLEANGRDLTTVCAIAPIIVVAGC